MKRLAPALLVLFAAAACQAQNAPGKMVPAAEAHSFQIGTLRLTALHDADFNPPNDGKVFGVDQGAAAVADVLQAHGAPKSPIHLSVDALLVQDGAHLVLIDTGLGPKANGALMGSLARAGVRPAAITDVLITHAHPDHIGGLTTADGKPAFPNATVRMSATEWAWVKSNPGMAAFVATIGPQVKPFTPGDIVAPGITAIALPGHTPGHCGYEIVSGKDRLIDIGDTAHSSIISLAEPDWNIAFDSDKAEGRATRRAELTKLAASHEEVFAPHFPFPGIGTISASGDGFVWNPAK
ncbi:MBL fold metallo-hydrolase [Asticcacaulis sp. EMRT-3]|uniref:MBL fold metallo-hydrolase n=1 Tax=Asticcacaulis sp. EMRT-3 TaxID=3040349 RepID=UPI0024AF6DE6|nr:MBL fold metallo-hydrolase [Asticcacaulis sp. EMRT-3]MDI7775097.1 MBL fold metallo-hydrolase [Asticcacaulis sp. EMRT-3]